MFVADDTRQRYRAAIKSAMEYESAERVAAVETLPATIDIPGRLHMYDRNFDLPFVRLIDDSGLPLTREAIEEFLEYFPTVSREIATRLLEQSKKALLEPA